MTKDKNSDHLAIIGVLKILRKRIAHLINQSVNDGGVCRTAPATPGLLNRVGMYGSNDSKS